MLRRITVRISKYCSSFNSPLSRCHVPLIEICDSTTQIKLDLGSCGICATTPTALLLKKGGCIEWETICETPKNTCCGVIDNRPPFFGSKRAVEKPKPSIIYPLHEIDPQGLSVFALDGKLKELGYGRWHGTILLTYDHKMPNKLPISETDFIPTEIIFDVDYVQYKLGVQSIAIETVQPNFGAC